MNWILLLVLAGPVIWLFVQRRYEREVSTRTAMLVYLVLCLAYGVGSLLSSRHLNFANVSPYIIGYNFVQPIFAGKDMHDGPLVFGKILPVAFLLYPFLLYSPLALVSASRPVLRIWLQTALYFVHTAWTGVCLFFIEMD